MPPFELFDIIWYWCLYFQRRDISCKKRWCDVEDISPIYRWWLSRWRIQKLYSGRFYFSSAFPSYTIHNISFRMGFMRRTSHFAKYGKFPTGLIFSILHVDYHTLFLILAFRSLSMRWLFVFLPIAMALETQLCGRRYFRDVAFHCHSFYLPLSLHAALAQTRWPLRQNTAYRRITTVAAIPSLHRLFSLCEKALISRHKFSRIYKIEMPKFICAWYFILPYDIDFASFSDIDTGEFHILQATIASRLHDGHHIHDQGSISLSGLPR